MNASSNRIPPSANTKLHKVILIAIIAVTLAKVSLAGEGFRTFPDENRYLASGLVLESLAHFNFKDAAGHLFDTQGRPGEVLIKTIPAAVQFGAAELLNIETYESQNSYPLFIFNFIIYIAILFNLYRLALLLLKNRLPALLSVLLYCCLVNSYIYIRHALPFDFSLLVMLYILNKILIVTQQNSFTLKKSFGLGFFAFFGYLCYPGYIILFFILFIMFLLDNLTVQKVRERIKMGLFYVLGSISCLAFFELISFIGDTSYIADSVALSKTITQGSFNEGFVFILKYFYEAEQMGGLLLLAGIITYTGCLVHHIFILKKKPESLQYLFTAAVLLFLFYSAMGYFFHTMIWYGRLLHQFYPVFVVAAAFAAANAFSQKASRVLVPAAALLFIINFTVNLSEYHKYIYPQDVAWKLVRTYPDAAVSNVSEYPSERNMLAYLQDKHRITNIRQRFTVVNGYYFYPFDDINLYQKYQPENGMKLIFSGPYFHNYPAYLYEGADAPSREIYRTLNMQVKVYKSNIP